MKVQSARWKRLGMLAVLGMVVYQGFLCTTRFEVGQKLEELGCSDGLLRNADISYRAQGNAAPLYEAAARLQESAFRGDHRTVNLEYFRQDRASAELQLAGQQLAFDLLRRASAQSRCAFSYSQINGEPYSLGYRSLVQAACLEMMRLAEQGQVQEAMALAQDGMVMIERFEDYPTAIHHAISLSLAEQLTDTVQELNAAFPDQGFESLAPDLARLARALDRGFQRCPSFEREQTVELFDKKMRGDRTGSQIPAEFCLLGLQIARAELVYLRASQDAEQALRDGDDERLREMMIDLSRQNEVAAAMTVSWPTLAKRHREVMKELRPN